ncbi:MAG TPA: hypothetical protein VLK33_05290 [Terriglobales bacterium]|nr:hypothetical protein [Terriglobales bacterium]
MHKLIVFIGILILTPLALADPLTYTVMGDGGTSSPVPGVSDGSFLWAGTGGQNAMSGSVLTGYGFDPLAGAVRGTTPDPFSSNAAFSGSLLLSSVFTVDGTQQLTVNFAELSAQQFASGNFEFAVLLQNNQVAAILGLVSPVATVKGTEDQNRLGTTFVPLTSGVQMTINSEHGAYSQAFQLGSTQYGCTGPFGDFQGPCDGDFTSTYTPTAGSYQLLFGAYGQPQRNGATAIAVKSVKVPEEGVWADLFISLLGLTLVYWRWRSVTLRASKPALTGLN